MNDTLVIRRLEPHEWPAYRAMRLRALADSPDAFTATLAEAQARPLESWSARLCAAAASSEECPLVAELGNVIVGQAWAMVDANDSAVVNIFQMWVAPESRGAGAAAGLLHAAIDWAASRRARAVQLDVTCGNGPAERLYARAGFRNVGAPQPRDDGSSFYDQTMRLDLAGHAP